MLAKLQWCRDTRSEAQVRDIQNLSAIPYDGSYLAEWIAAEPRKHLVGVPTVNDTPPEVRQLVHELLMRRSPEERFLMDSSMFLSARTMVLASLSPDLPPNELRRRLFRRFYGDLPEHLVPEPLRIRPTTPSPSPPE